MLHLRGLRILSLLFLIVAAACSPKTTGEEYENFDPGQFSQPTQIDNEWFPLPPGAQLTFEGFTSSQGEQLTHRVIFTVTDLVKEIAGIKNVVAWERDYSEDQLVEAELVFFAQADDGTVWSLGQYPEEYDEGKIIDSPSWIHGVEEAVAGISMQGDPQPGPESYSQGWGPAVEYTDRAMVSKEGQQVCVPFDCYDEVLVIDETSLLEPDAHQLKFFARGVGNIKVDWTGEDQTQETLELTGFTMLDAAAMAEVQAEALKLEASAYEHSPDVYGKTSPAVPAMATDSGDQPTAAAAEIVVYMIDIGEGALTELDFVEDSASPGGFYVSLPNNGDELDPPPENDPHATFPVTVVSGTPYRCWVHMKVGTPLEKSQANLVFLQFSNALDAAGNKAYLPGSNSYLTAQGPTTEGWTWVGCDLQGGAEGTLVNFSVSGAVTVRIQAGAEGVGFDQFVLSPTKYLEMAPSEAVVAK
ncbi:MAG TPA: hypothetical protein VN364_12885 [Bellilinea sp.]|nr:hypothetical protein [Bellilinea sp.]